MRKRENGILKKLMILACWLIAWQAISLLCDNSILLVGPWETACALGENLVRVVFWKTVLVSCCRILLGFFAAAALGILLAAGSYRVKLLEDVLHPVMTLFKAIPVASFAVLLLIWWGSSGLSVWICFLVVLPQIYVNTLEGLKNTDRKLLEMARVFRIPLYNKVFYLYRPAIRPFLVSGVRIAAGMAWKSGVAAEVIGTPDFSIGERLYLSKIYLDTADVFAWTAVVILLSMLMEKLVLWGLHIFFIWEPACRAAAAVKIKDNCLAADHVFKSYDGVQVISDHCAVYEKDNCYFFTSPSGSGKTTLFRLLSGLEEPDRGQISGNESICVMFQEDRLCEDYSAVKNVEMITGDAKSARQELEKLLPADALDKPCRFLSGGMRRRVALVRAFAAKCRCILLDEPWNGLDQDNRDKVWDYIRQSGRNRILLIASHDAFLKH